MTREQVMLYKKSGQILAQSLEYALSITKPGIKLADIAEKVENLIRENSAQPAFPVNISINEIAAHYSPVINDDLVIPVDSIVKIDAGVQVNGFITDAARTIIFNDKWEKMKLLARKALDKAIAIIKPGTTVYEVGEIVEKTINQEGFKPIVNLSGHSLAQYSLHDGISIPNYKIPKRLRDKTQFFRAGGVYAIEPFVTTGKGKVKNGRDMTIFRQFREVKVDSLPKKIREGYLYIEEHFYKMPFSPRWLHNADFPIEQVEDIMNDLINRNIVCGYPVLIESTGAPVTQAEETILVGKDKTYILTNTKNKEK
ncbi:MAG: type II methionyl aminopeptidase [Candidatus Heimdallarchaeota archaeon]|nr:type II methionyl aminopeptidase [Candidatus Heimdallarchaeota archaeon]